MIKLTCIRDSNNEFFQGEDYTLLTRRGGGFVEVLTKDGYAKDFILKYDRYAIGYKVLVDYFNLVPVNKRMVFVEKINNTCIFEF